MIGCGSSGVDIVIHLSKYARSVTISRNKPKHETPEERQKYENAWPQQTMLKDNVKRFTERGAEFIDGTELWFTTIIFATGEKKNFN